MKMISAIGNMWFVIFILLFAAIQLGCIALDVYIKERKEEVYERTVNRKINTHNRSGS